MPSFLFKTEPGEFSYQDLVKKGRATWDGVSNPAALGHLRSVREGDTIYIYHTGDEKSVVGVAKAVGAVREDPKKPGVTPDGKPKFAVVDIAPVKVVPTPVSLTMIKADPRFAAFALVKQSRLSVMHVPSVIEKALRELARL